MVRQETYFVVGDWGTSQLRLNLATGTGVIDRCTGPGIGVIDSAPLDVLLGSLKPWMSRYPLRDVYLCGMAGSRNGLIEVPYLATPTAAEDWAARAGSLHAGNLKITIGAGLSGRNDYGAPDVMRGEETQAFGALLADPTLATGEHLLVLPGTHSKWLRLQNGSITGFDTYLTGELFALLRDHSTLLRTGGATDGITEGFEAGLLRSRARDGLAGRLFEARSAQLLQGRSRGWGEGFLSGLLIGDEITAAYSRARAGDAVRIIGDPQLCALYRRALAMYDVEAELLHGDRCSIEGLLFLANHDKDPQ